MLEVCSTLGAEPQSRRQIIKQFSKYVGLDVHKATIVVAVAEADGRSGNKCVSTFPRPSLYRASDLLHKPVQDFRRTPLDQFRIGYNTAAVVPSSSV